MSGGLVYKKNFNYKGQCYSLYDFFFTLYVLKYLG